MMVANVAWFVAHALVHGGLCAPEAPVPDPALAATFGSSLMQLSMSKREEMIEVIVTAPENASRRQGLESSPPTYNTSTDILGNSGYALTCNRMGYRYVSGQTTNWGTHDFADPGNEAKVTHFTVTAKGDLCYSGYLSMTLGGVTASSGICTQSLSCGPNLNRCTACTATSATYSASAGGIPGWSWGLNSISITYSGGFAIERLVIDVFYEHVTPDPTPYPTQFPRPYPTQSPTPPLPPGAVVQTTVSGSISVTAGGTATQVADIMKPPLAQSLGISDLSGFSVTAAPTSQPRMAKMREVEHGSTEWDVTYTFVTGDPAEGALVSQAGSELAADPAALTTLSSTIETEFINAGLDFDPSAFTAAPPSIQTTVTAVEASGDPHFVNMYGQRFDLMQPGRHNMLNIPKGAKHWESLLLRADADTWRVGAACGEIYIKAINVTGLWANRVRDGGIYFDAASPQKARWIGVGSIDLKVVWGHTRDGVLYLNVAVRHLNRISLPIGGLLGSDDHTQQITPDPLCRDMLALGLELRDPNTSIAIE